jgi:hypothetical protein
LHRSHARSSKINVPVIVSPIRTSLFFISSWMDYVLACWISIRETRVPRSTSYFSLLILISASRRSIICSISVVWHCNYTVQSSIGNRAIQSHFWYRLSREWLQSGFELVIGFIELL